MKEHEVFKALNMLMTDTKSILDVVDDVQRIRLSIEEDDVYEEFVNTVRSIVQREAKWAVIDAGGRGLVAMATGSGKSKVAIDLTQYYHESTWKDLTLIVPTEELRDNNWKEEFIKWEKEAIYDKLQRLCYASASKVSDKYINLAILDEGHNITELSMQFFVNNDVENIVVLTATEPTDEAKQEMLKKLGVTTVYKLTLDDAVKLGFVAPYKITVVYTELDKVDKYVKSGTKAKPFFQTEEKKYAYLSNLCMMRTRPLAAIDRMRFISNLRSKTIASQWILDNLIPQDERILIFAGSIEQAQALCVDTYHSKSSDEALNKFRRDELQRLSCVQALNEGGNFIGLDGGLITQINSKEKNLIQRLGRLIRFRVGHEAHLYIVVAKGTQDEKWLISCTENLDQSKIEYIDFEQLKQVA